MKNHYFAIVHHDPGSAYGASFPDLPGCFAAADDQEDLMRNAIEAVDDYLSDQDEAPKAATMSDIAKAFADDLKEGAYLLAVPYVANEGKTTRANISIDRGLLASIDEIADLRGFTRSGFLALAAMHEMQFGHDTKAPAVEGVAIRQGKKKTAIARVVQKPRTKSAATA
jgi:predicted RNase H-like HicB family nuclease